MNRPIKFRAWDKQHNRFYMEDDFYIKNDGTAWLIEIYRGDGWDADNLDLTYEELKVELQQFTGLTDKNGTGKEIYEGDIVNFYDPKYPAHFSGGKVVFNDACFWVEYQGRWMPIHELEQFEVTSNIYENEG